VFWLLDDSLYNFLSLLQWAVFALASLQLAKWKEKWLGKLSIRWEPGENSWFRLSKARKVPFRQLLVFTIELLILVHCLGVSWQVVIQWGIAILEWCSSKSEIIVCYLGSDTIQR